jgi:putative protein-disulfide isomerase
LEILYADHGCALQQSKPIFWPAKIVTRSPAAVQNSMPALLYFTDPMCSWCYGFGPGIEAIAAAYSDRAPVSVVVGGLRPDEDRPLPERMAREIAHHWEMVNQASGVEFDFSFFEKRPGFVYNTAPACRAVAAANLLDSSRTLQFQHALQRRFYRDAEDPAALETFQAAARDSGYAAAEFTETYAAQGTETVMRQQFDFARSWGIGAFPTLVLNASDTNVLVTQGYLGREDLQARIDALLERYSPAL